MYVECQGDMNALLTRWDISIKMKDKDPPHMPSHHEPTSIALDTIIHTTSSGHQVFSYMIPLATVSSSSSLSSSTLLSSHSKKQKMKKLLIPFKDMKSLIKTNKGVDIYQHIANIVQVSALVYHSLAPLPPLMCFFHFMWANARVYPSLCAFIPII
jgi:flagellar biosynthesis protein FlhB